MAGVNKVILLGNLGRDPELRYFESGAVVANLSLATSETYKDKQGNKVETTEWHSLEMWDGLAKVAEGYLRQGDTIYVEGKVRSNTWQDDQGNNRKTIRIRVLNMNIVKRLHQGEPIRPLQSSPQQQKQSQGGNTSNNTAPAPATAQEPKSDPLASTTSGSENEVDDLPF